MWTKRYISLTAHPGCHNLIIIGISCYLLFFLYLAVARGHKHCYKAHATIRCGRRNDSPRRARGVGHRRPPPGAAGPLPASYKENPPTRQTNSLLNATSAAYNISSRLTAHKTKQLQACPLYSLDLWCSLPVLLVTLPCEYHRPETRQRVCRGIRP